MPQSPRPLGGQLDEIRAAALDAISSAILDTKKLHRTFRENLWDAEEVDRIVVTLNTARQILEFLGRPLTAVEDYKKFQPTAATTKPAPPAPVPIAGTPTTTATAPPRPACPDRVSFPPYKPRPPQSDAASDL